MNCVKCGNKLKRNEEFCTYCGYYNGEVNDTGFGHNNKNDGEHSIIINSSEEVDFKNSITDESDNKTDLGGDNLFSSLGDTDDEELLDAYIGSEYGLVSKFPFNPYALVFSWLYFIYKKMALIGVVGLVISLFVLAFFRSYLIIYLIISRIIISIIFNPIYKSVVKSRIKKIVKKYEGTDIVSMRNICEEKGGTNTFLTLMFFTLFLGGVVFIVVKGIGGFGENSFKPKFWNENSQNEATCNSILRTSYKDLLDNLDIGTLDSGTCKITKGKTKSYDVYIKTKNENKYIFYYYKAQDGVTSFQLSTDAKDELEEISTTGNITEKELKDLKEMKLIESNYNRIISDSKLEDKQIINKTNTDEKLNYSFTREEITRK